jgi:hypothetical protein
VEVTYINISLYTSVISVTWPTYHDCDHICITPMVDPLLLRWFMIYKLLVVIDVLIDVYVTLFIYTLLT